MGLAFEKNCSDLRNSKVADFVQELKQYGLKVNVHDLYVNREEARREFSMPLEDWKHLPKADALILAVAHRAFLGASLEELTSKVRMGGCIVNVKSVLNKETLEGLGLHVWRL